MLGLNGKLLDFIYPIGSYYETSDTLFNPNVTWGGTWIEDSKGHVTVALDNEDTDFNAIGKTGGEKTHTLTIAEMPAHNHKFNFRTSGSQPLEGNHGAYLLAGTNDTAIASTGGGQAHNNMQPYIVVKRWHRTA